MAQVSGSHKAHAKSLSRINIAPAANGVMVTEEMVPKESKNGMMWSPLKPRDSMVFTSLDEFIEYVRECTAPLFKKAGK